MNGLLEEAWCGRAPVTSAALVPLSWAYGAGEALHRALYRAGLRHAARASAPVISVGNLVVGGAGKTPVTLELARRFTAAGHRVGILSRGYGRDNSHERLVVSEGHGPCVDAAAGGDEPVWLARKAPSAIVVVARERAAAAVEAVRLGADLLLLDDGFSHHALARDADVLVVDDAWRFGNGRLLPAGPLREPLGSISRASLAWLTRTHADAPVPEGLAHLPLVRSTYAPSGLVDLSLAPREPLSSLAGRRVLAVCGIARPRAFEASLASLGAQVASLRAFADHHRFLADEVAALLREADALHCEWIVTTEKDAMRLPADPSNRFRALAMALEVVGDPGPVQALVRRFSPGASAS